MRRILLAICLIAMFCPWIHGQSRTVITGTVQAPTGIAATSGYVEFRIRPNSSSIAYRVAGTAVLAPQTSRCAINSSGSVVALAGVGSCQVWGNTLITPAATGYDVVFAPNGTVSSTIQNELISGASYDLSTPVFNSLINLVPQYQTLTTAPINVNLVCVADKQCSLGDSGHYYGQAWIDILNVNQFNGTMDAISAQSINARQMCDRFSGATAGAKITACIAALPAAGGVADATGLQGGQTLGTVTINKTGTQLQLGAGTYTGTIAVTANNVMISGSGRGSSTIIAASTSASTLSLNEVNGVTISHLSIQAVVNTSSNAKVILLQPTSGGSNYNVFDDVEVDGPGRGAASTTNTSKCFEFDSGGGTKPVFFNRVLNSYIQGCNILFHLKDGDANMNHFIGNQLNGYWNAFNIDGVENVSIANTFSSASGASSVDPTTVYVLNAGATYNNLAIPTGEPGTNARAVDLASTVTNNYFTNICTLNFDLGIGTNLGTGNPGLNVADCNKWNYLFNTLSENTTYRLGSFSMPTGNRSADVLIQYDGHNSSTQCTSSGLVHGSLQTSNAGTITATALNVTESDPAGAGCPSFSGWDISGSTVYPVFFMTNNGTASTATVVTVTIQTSAGIGTMSRVVTSKGAGNVAPTTVVSANAATAQEKGHFHTTVSGIVFANWTVGTVQCNSVGLTVPGILGGDIVNVGINQALGGLPISYTAYADSANLVGLKGCNNTAVAVTAPGAQTLHVDWWRY